MSFRNGLDDSNSFDGARVPSSSLFRRMARSFLVAAALLAPLAPRVASADPAGAQGFVQSTQAKLAGLVKQGPSANGQVSQTMDAMVDYELLAQRTFGNPCAKGVSTCVNHWNELTPPQRAEVTALLKKLVVKNYQKNLQRTLDYDVTYKSSQEQGKDVRVRTSNKSRTKAREAPYTIDYVVIEGAGGSYRVVDIVTEGSSLVKNYYEQFHKMLGTPGQGYPYIATKLNEKLAKP